MPAKLPVLLHWSAPTTDAVLRFLPIINHLQKYRPDQPIDVQSEPQLHQLWINQGIRLPYSNLVPPPGPYSQSIVELPQISEAHDKSWPPTPEIGILLGTLGIEPDPTLLNYQPKKTSAHSESYVKRQMAERDTTKMVTISARPETDMHLLESLIRVIKHHGYWAMFTDGPAQLRALVQDHSDTTCFCGTSRWLHEYVLDTIALFGLSRLNISIDGEMALSQAAVPSVPSLAIWTEQSPFHYMLPVKHQRHLMPEKLWVEASWARTYPSDHTEEEHLPGLACLTLSSCLTALACGEQAYGRPPGVEDKRIGQQCAKPVVSTTLPNSRGAFDTSYYERHRNAGLDYLAHGDWHSRYASWLTESLEWKGRTVLDVGTACGAIVKSLAAADVNAHGVDLNEDLILKGRQAWPDISRRLKIMDALNLHAYDDQSQDAIHLLQVCHQWHPDHVPLILRELHRITKIGGFLFCVLETIESRQRQKRPLDAGIDASTLCLQSESWWKTAFTEQGWEPATTKELAPLKKHPENFLAKYPDWSWYLFKAVEMSETD